MKRSSYRRLAWLAAGGCGMMLGGCVNDLTANLDRLLSPTAFDNALTLPNLPFADFAFALIRLL